MVNNDNSRDSVIILTGLKCIFQKQLPKMPKDYIARLVYDRTHLSMAIIKHPLEVVGYASWPKLAIVANDRIEGLPTVPSTLESLQKSSSVLSHPTNKSKATALT